MRVDTMECEKKLEAVTHDFKGHGQTKPPPAHALWYRRYLHR